MKRLLLPALAVLAAATAHAQLSYDTIGSVYTQDFNTLIQTGSGSLTGRGPFDVTTGNLLSSGTLPGWTFSNYLGTSTPTITTEWRAQDGSGSGASGRGAVSFGLTGDSDRALGTLATGQQISRFGLTIQNNTGSALDSFSLSYDGEIWRSGESGRTNNLFFSYAIVSSSPDINGTGFTDVASLNYTMTAFAPFETAVNGNLNSTFLSDTIGGLTWNPGDYLIVRWSGQDVPGQDNGLAVDNVTFSATAVPEPTTWALLGLGAAGALALRRRRTS